MLRIQNEHDWNEQNDSLCYNIEDGAIFLYRYLILTFSSMRILLKMLLNNITELFQIF